MTHAIERLEERLGWLERDVLRLKQQVEELQQGSGMAPAVPEPAPAPAAQAKPAPHPHPRRPAQMQDEATTPPLVAPSTPPVVRAPVSIVNPGQRPTSPAPRTPAPTLERRIGGQVFAVAGALIVIIGLGLAVKVAVDYGWFRVLSPGVRCIGIAALGAAVLGAGELFRKRIWPIAIAGCNAVGVAALYLAAYAAFGVFHLIAAPAAFALMALGAGVGLVVARRHGFLSTGLLSLIGAYLVPILLAGSEAGPLVMPVYLLLLSVVSLALAFERPRAFGAMRDAAWLGSALLGFAWTVATVADHPWLALGFWSCVWALHQGELLLTAAHGRLRPEPADERPSTRRFFRRRVEPVLLAIATTAGVVAMAAVILEHHLGLEPWMAPALGLAVTSAIALTFGGHLRVLRDTPRTDLETLAAAHAAQAGGLLVATVALALSGWVEATAWLAMGVAAVVAGRWVAARSLDLYGLALLSIATVRICTFDLFLGSAGVPWTTDAPLVLAPWTVLIAGAGIAWMLSARLMLHEGRDEDAQIISPARPRLAALCAGVGVCALLITPAHPESSVLAVCVAWLVLSLLLRGAALIEGRLRLAEMSMIAACLALVPWAIGADFETWLGSRAALGAHPGAWLGALCAAVLLAHAWCSRRWDGQTGLGPTNLGSVWPLPVWHLMVWLGAGLVFVASSFEVARGAAMLADDLTARRAAVSIWWGLWGVSLVVGGFWRRAGAVRYVGLALMSAAALKAVLLDLAGVPPLWRVASFVGLGGLMLGVAMLYGRVSASIVGAEGQTGQTPDDNP